MNCNLLRLVSHRKKCASRGDQRWKFEDVYAGIIFNSISCVKRKYEIALINVAL